MKRILCFCMLAAAGAVSLEAGAHHTFSMFDSEKQVTLKGTVKEFQWTNPHSWLEMEVVNDSGEAEAWSIEMLSPNVLGRMGWKRNSLQPGDEVTVVINPLRNGANGGNMISVQDEAGQYVGGPPQ